MKLPYGITRTRARNIFFFVIVLLAVCIGVAIFVTRAYGAADRIETVSVWEKANQHRIRVVDGSDQVTMTLILDNGDERCGIVLPGNKARGLGIDLKQAADASQGIIP